MSTDIDYGDNIEPTPDRGTGVPYCSSECKSYDGKRCRLLGRRPDSICEPAVEQLLEIIGTYVNAPATPETPTTKGTP